MWKIFWNIEIKTNFTGQSNRLGIRVNCVFSFDGLAKNWKKVKNKGKKRYWLRTKKKKPKLNKNNKKYKTRHTILRLKLSDVFHKSPKGFRYSCRKIE